LYDNVGKLNTDNSLFAVYGHGGSLTKKQAFGTMRRINIIWSLKIGFMNLAYISGMVIRHVLVMMIVMLAGYTRVTGQEGEFCKAVTTITSDAPNKFRNVRGKLIESGVNATFWNCNIPVPGVIKSRFVASMGLFYEGAVFQTKNKEEIKAAYDKCKEALTGCLGGLNYKLTTQSNFYPGLEAYKKLVYMQDIKEDALPEKPPAHITMEAAYSKEIGLYTVVMYIFEH
jgi:hypothetical protein